MLNSLQANLWGLILMVWELVRDGQRDARDVIALLEVAKVSNLKTLVRKLKNLWLFGSICIGTRSSLEELYNDTKKIPGCEVFGGADNILRSAKLADRQQTLNLYKVSVRELGFEQPAPAAEVYRQAELRFGLGTCFPEFGLQLLLQWGCREGEDVLIAMESFHDPNETPGNRCIMNLRSNVGKRQLGTRDIAQYRLRPEEELIFMDYRREFHDP